MGCGPSPPRLVASFFPCFLTADAPSSQPILTYLSRGTIATPASRATPGWAGPELHEITKKLRKAKVFYVERYGGPAAYIHSTQIAPWGTGQPYARGWGFDFRNKPSGAKLRFSTKEHNGSLEPSLFSNQFLGDC